MSDFRVARMNKTDGTERAYFAQLPRCTQRAIEKSLAQQLEERTLQAAKRALVRKQVQHAVR